MTPKTNCSPRASVFARDCRATVLNLETFLSGKVDGAEFFDENYFTIGMVTPAQRKLGRPAFDALPYAERIVLCERLENMAGPSPEAWTAINAHLGTTAADLPDLVGQLASAPSVTGRVWTTASAAVASIPFEAARVGCEAFGSDLIPVAGLLTWASLNLLAGGPDVQREVMRVQAAALQAADENVANANC